MRCATYFRKVTAYAGTAETIRHEQRRKTGVAALPLVAEQIRNETTYHVLSSVQRLLTEVGRPLLVALAETEASLGVLEEPVRISAEFWRNTSTFPRGKHCKVTPKTIGVYALTTSLRSDYACTPPAAYGYSAIVLRAQLVAPGDAVSAPMKDVFGTDEMLDLADLPNCQSRGGGHLIILECDPYQCSIPLTT